MSIRTLIIGLDGATFDVLDPLMDEGVMPFLREFVAGGVRAPLRTIVPPLTPPAWTSLMTGRTPGHHGVFDFFRRESADSFHIRFFTSRDVASETIWSIAADRGLRVSSLNFPSMFPPPQLPGYVVPGWVPWRQLRLACWPDDLFGRLKQLPDFNARELAMDFKLEERATEGCSQRHEYEPWVDFHIRREKNWLRTFRYLTQEDPSALTAVLFDGVDKLQHLCWRFIAPEKPLTEDWELAVREACLNYFRELDDILREMCELAGPEAAVLIASDHGFGPTHEVFHINAWLARKGYLGWSEAARNWDTQGATLGVGQVARHTWLLDWDKTKAFAPTPTSNGVFIAVDRNGGGKGVPAAEYEGFRARLIADLKEVRDAETGAPIVERIWTREQAFAGPQGALAPDLTIALRDGGLVSILPADEDVSPREEIAGTHRPVGIFAARGPGVRSGARLDELSILDIAPLTLYILGLPVLETMEGTVPSSLFEASKLEADPIQTTQARTAAAAADTTDAGRTYSEEDEQAIMSKMQELGYLD